jgi:hypothetical protein
MEKQDKQNGKEDELEENDFKALLIAAFSVFGPILIGILVFFALIILLVVLFIH